MRPFSTISAIVILFTAETLVGQVQDTRSVAYLTPEGATTVETRGTASQSVVASAWGDYESPPEPRADGQIWHNTLASAIYNNTAISMPAARVCAGTGLNLPLEFELIPLEGDGTADWVYPGTEFQVAASRDANVLAAIEYDYGTNAAIVHCWHPGSSTPDWSYPISSCGLATQRSIAVSPNGAIIAVLIELDGPPLQTRLYYFGPSSSTPLGMFDPTAASYPRNLDISADGRYVAVYTQAEIHVFDTTTALSRYGASAGASADSIAISGDGQYLAYGWSSLFLRSWTGASYSSLWSRPGSGFYLGSCAISTDGSTLVAGWYRSDYKQNRIELYEIPSNVPKWTYLFTVSDGTRQELPADVAVLADGSYCAVASWGDANSLNPEVLVFGHADNTPLLTLDTPGSMFDVDIAAGPTGPVYISACGKHVHANAFGSGGDLYTLRLERYGTGDLNCDGTYGYLSFGDINPFVLYLSSFSTWEATYPDCPPTVGDINGDGTYGHLSFGDINPFVALLSTGN